jgi:hypothetical protein
MATSGELHRLDLLGAWVAHAVFLLTIAVFLCRLAGRSRAEHRLGGILLLIAVPLLFLLVLAPRHQRPTLYYVQIVIMLVYLVVEFLLDYALRFEFRHTQWMVVAYVTLFFAGTGGMVGLAARAGRPYAVSSALLFFAMTALAFVQRARTGM